MRKVFLIFIFALAAGASAQTYSISPAKTVSFTAPYFNVTINDIYMVNTGGTTLSITWELISVSVPLGWDYSMCDLGTCHPGIPAGPTTMSTASAGGADPFLGLNIDPQNIAGNGVVTVRVYKTGSPSQADTLKWNIVSAPVGLDEQDMATTMIYPNPAAEKIHLRFVKASGRELIVSDALGKVRVRKHSDAAETDLDLSDLPKGVYVLSIASGENKFSKRIVKD